MCNGENSSRQNAEFHKKMFAINNTSPNTEIDFHGCRLVFYRDKKINWFYKTMLRVFFGIKIKQEEVE